jgi:hypothetical protein
MIRFFRHSLKSIAILFEILNPKGQVQGTAPTNRTDLI